MLDLALKELGDVEEDGKDEDGEEVGEQVVSILCSVLLPPAWWVGGVSISQVGSAYHR